MFDKLRLRLTLYFVISAGIVYVVLAFAGSCILAHGLDNSINEELSSMAEELNDIIDMSNLEPELNHWRKANNKSELMPTVQIFSKSRQLLGESGPIKSIPLVANKGPDKVRDEVISHNHVRVLTREIDEESEASWMQISIPLRQRDLALDGYTQTCIFLTPLLLLSLSIAGYLFARHAVCPVEQSYQILKHFVADAGHELNTPIAILQANVEALADDPAELEFTVPVILRTCQRMSNLISDLLYLAKVESPIKGKESSYIDLKEMFDSLQEEFLRLYQAKGLQLSCSSPDGLKIFGDNDAVHRALANLLKNALNYTESGSVSMRASASRNFHHACIAVQDSGVGIPEESQSRIFDRFYRVQKAKSEKSGAGLGLAIVRAIVDSHGGSIEVRSLPGEGSTFLIEFPLITQFTSTPRSPA